MPVRAPALTTNGVHHSTDEAIDLLYAWMPTAQAPQPCPEAAFSCTVKGLLDGHETLLTIRGQTADEFKRNLAAVRGLLDTPQPKAPQPVSQGKEWCAVHNMAMQLNQKEGRSWYSHRLSDGWCKGR